jgi:hypothetical protein
MFVMGAASKVKIGILEKNRGKFVRANETHVDDHWIGNLLKLQLHVLPGGCIIPSNRP